MFRKILDFVKENRAAQLGLALLAGAIIGAVFYPTQHIEKEFKAKYEEELNKTKEVFSAEKSKLTEEKNQAEKQLSQTKIETERKISKLTTEVRDLKSKQKTAYYKIVRPDGTIEIKKFSETEVNESTKVVQEINEEFKQKIEQIEDRWKSIHETRVAELSKNFASKETDYQKRIKELESKEVIDVNPKRFGVEVGATTAGATYGHVTGDIFGPLFLGVHGETKLIDMGKTPDNALGAGVGIRF